jgi:sulfatase maturation enzyme AslB (radical SAM superfamily)
MRPKTSVELELDSFNRLKNKINLLSQANKKKKQNDLYVPQFPNDIGLQINMNCNLRCKTCFLWNKEGRYSKLQRDEYSHELSPNVIDKILKETKPAKSNLFFWATEPLFHSQWDQISKLLEADKRWTVLCTNGILIEKQLDTLLRFSDHLATVVSLDGFEYEHDSIRGKGNFKKTINNINLLIDLRKKNIYKGKITVHCVINNDLVKNLYKFMEFTNDMDLDSVYLGFPWYISENTALTMDHYFKVNFPWLSECIDDKGASWHQYCFHIDADYISDLKNELNKINSRKWEVRIRFQPSLEINELNDFIAGGQIPVQNKKSCFATSTRLDVLANGDVTSCQCYPEFNVGNLYNEGLLDVWHGEKFKMVREKLSLGLMPVCSKCILLYLNGL